MNKNQATQQASQRLLEYISGTQAGSVQSSAPSAEAGARETETARPAPSVYRRRQKDAVAVVFDALGAMLARGNASLGRIGKIDYYAFPVGVVFDRLSRFRWLTRILRDFAPDRAGYDLWVVIPESDCETYLLKMPKVKDAEMDAMALLHANKQNNLDVRNALFDYRVVADLPPSSDGLAQVLALALSSENSFFDQTRTDFNTAGLKADGTTSRKLASFNLVNADLVKTDWTTYAVLTVEDNFSFLSIFSNGLPLLQRTIKSGLSMTAGHSTAGSDAAVSESDYTEWQAPDAEPSESDAGDVSGTFSSNIARVVKYTDRTLSFFQRTENNPRLQGILVASTGQASAVLIQSIRLELGLDCRAIELRPSLLGAVAAAVDRQHKAGRAGLVFEAAGIAMATPKVPNLMLNPQQRRESVRRSQVVRALYAVAGSLCACAIAVGAVGGYQWFNAAQEHQQRLLEQQRWNKHYSAEQLQNDMRALARSEQQGVRLLQRRRYAVALAELAALTGEAIYVTEIEFSSKAETAVRKGQEKKPLNATPLVLVRGIVCGTALQRETELADFITRVKSSALITSIEIQKQPAQGNVGEFSAVLGGL